MRYLITNANVFYDDRFVRKDLFVENGLIADISDRLLPVNGVTVFDFNNMFVFPGLIDVHVHLREPGFFYKETIKTGTRAAARGGFTAVCSMPNLDPVPDSQEHLAAQTEIIARDACVHVYPYGSITVAEKQQALSDMENIADKVAAFSDDGVGVQSEEMMRQAMQKAKGLGKMIVAHCEVNALLGGTAIHDGAYARKLGHKGISSESEWREVERNIALSRETGCALHICHISAKESVELLRKAKAEGLDVTGETAPHYLTLSDKDLRDDGAFRMNPPLRDESDRQALLKGVKDGTIDMIATDHAPHSTEEKGRGLLKSLNGIVGLETAFPVLYTRLVKTGEISLEKLLELMHTAPSKRFKIGGPLKPGAPADLTVFDLNKEYEIKTSDFLSMGSSSPFAGDRVYGKCKLTMAGGKIVWQEA